MRFPFLLSHRDRPVNIISDLGSFYQQQVILALRATRASLGRKVTELLFDVSSVQQFSIPDGAHHTLVVARQSLLFAASHGMFQPPVTVTVVDPTVGTSERESIALETNNGLRFVGPNNGVFGPVITHFGLKYAVILDPSLRSIPSDESASFDGRDFFAPVAGMLTCEKHLSAVGRELEPGSMRSFRFGEGDIATVDPHGNLKVTGFADAYACSNGTLHFGIHGRSQVFTAKKARSYSEVPIGALVAIPGSTHLGEERSIDIGINQGSAAEHLAVRSGDRLVPINAETLAPR